MTKLNLKDLSFNWEAPVVTYTVTSSAPEDFLLLKRINQQIHKTKYSCHTITLKKQNIKHFFKEGEEPKGIAISLETDKRIIFVFNPKPGIPFYKLKKYSDGSYILSNRDIVEKIYKHLGLSDEVKNYYLKGYKKDEYNGMILYQMTPQHHNTKFPVFDDELLGKD